MKNNFDKRPQRATQHWRFRGSPGILAACTGRHPGSVRAMDGRHVSEEEMRKTPDDVAPIYKKNHDKVRGDDLPSA